MPVLDSSGIMKPLLLKNIEEAIEAGIEEIALIIREEERDHFEHFFKEPSPPEVVHKLSRQSQQYARYLEEIGRKITFISQENPRGLGDAVLQAREWVGDAPFLLLLGDHYFSSSADLPCAGQLVQGFDKINTNIVGVTKTSADDVHRFGTLTGRWEKPNKILEVTEIKEKPTAEYASEHLFMEGFDENTFLTVFGQYILTPAVFSELENMIEEDMFEKGELELTTALERLRNSEGLYGQVIEGEKIDIGVPDAYRRTFETV
jgi:UTP--glucose-1-phosphate uridylyltransferase